MLETAKRRNVVQVKSAACALLTCKAARCVQLNIELTAVLFCLNSTFTAKMNFWSSIILLVADGDQLLLSHIITLDSACLLNTDMHIRLELQ
jgi:hypothetical protein